MARPTKVKENKPKPLEGIDGEAPVKSAGLNPIMLILMAVVIVIGSGVTSAASVYFLAPMVIKPMLAQLSPKADGEGADGGKAAAPAETVGPVLELEEFTVNLKDPGGNRYLRATVSISLTADDPKFEKLTGEAAKKWDEDFKGEMAPYVPAIRDIVISSLTKQYASTLATAQGKDSVRDEIKREVSGLLNGKHKVIRVNLENFVIQ